MPEIIEVECYRQLADGAVGRLIASVDAPDEWFLKGGVTPSDVIGALGGRRITGTRRIGKLLLCDLSEGGPTLGLRFGMTGRLVIDGREALDHLEYSSRRDEPGWDRLRVHFADGGVLRLQDPRRLGGVLLDPDESALGPDAWSITPARLREVLAGSGAPLKVCLLDQSRVAGIGNLICDETLWRAGLDPAREAGSLTDAERRRLARHLRATLDDLAAAGGSHTGRLHPARRRGSTCPKDGTPLLRRDVGGRTTYSCPRHQQ